MKIPKLAELYTQIDLVEAIGSSVLVFLLLYLAIYYDQLSFLIVFAVTYVALSIVGALSKIAKKVTGQNAITAIIPTFIITAIVFYYQIHVVDFTATSNPISLAKSVQATFDIVGTIIYLILTAAVTFIWGIIEMFFYKRGKKTIIPS